MSRREVDEQDLIDGITLDLMSNEEHSVVVRVITGKVHMQFLDRYTHAPLAARSYQIQDDESHSFSGTTDGDGKLLHQEMRLGNYTLTLQGVEQTLEALVLDDEDGEPQVRLV